jgi:hypothetical protein
MDKFVSALKKILLYNSPKNVFRRLKELWNKVLS